MTDDGQMNQAMQWGMQEWNSFVLFALRITPPCPSVVSSLFEKCSGEEGETSGSNLCKYKNVILDVALSWAAGLALSHSAVQK